MTAVFQRRYGRYTYALVAAIVAVVVLFLQNRAVDVQLHGRRMEMLLELRRLDALLDRDVLRASSFILDNFDPLVETTTQLRRLAEKMREPKRGFAAGTDAAVEAELHRTLGSLGDKLRYLEHIKSHTALVRNGLQYLPLAVDELAQGNPAFGTRLMGLLNRLYLYNLFPSESDLAALREEADRLEAASRGGPAQLGSTLGHMRAQLGRLATLVELRQHYNDIPTTRHLDALYAAYGSFYAERNLRSERVNIVLLVATLLLFALLGLVLRRLGRAHDETDLAWRRLHDAVGSLSEAFALFDDQRRLVLHNDKYLEFYPWLKGQLAPGMALEEILSLNRSSGALASHGEEGDEEGGEEVRAEEHGTRSYLQRLVDGRWYLASDSGTSSGGLVCVRVDITDSKQRELELRKLSRALAQSPASVVITDTNGTIEYVNPKFEEITGYSMAEALGQNPRILKSGSKPDYDYRAMWETISAGHEWRGIFLNRRKDGSMFWEAASISPLRDDHGRITHFIAVKEDITERKRAEEELRLHATVFDTATEGIIVTDANNRIKTVNTAFSRITGYARDEVVGRSPAFLQSGHHDAAFYQEMWANLQRDGCWAGEIWNRRKDATVYPEWLSIAAIKNDHVYRLE
jgi:PAS domain S-box-containing protein